MKKDYRGILTDGTNEASRPCKESGQAVRNQVRRRPQSRDRLRAALPLEDLLAGKIAETN